MGWQTILLLVGFFGLMMVMTIIPQRKQKKKMQQMMSSLTIGDKIMTIGGFVGTIVALDEAQGRYTVNISADEGCSQNVVIVKNAVRTKLTENAPTQGI